MIRVNLLDTDIVLKIVITGPERSGKTAVITYLALNIRKKFRSALTSHTNLVGRTTFFDHLRVTFGKAGGRLLLLDLFTVPGSQSLAGKRRKVLSYADGVIFTLDSSGQGRVNNLKSAAEFISWLRTDGVRPSRFPVVYLYHKDDLRNGSSLVVFKKLLRLSRAPEVGGSAYEGYGIWEALAAAVKTTLASRGMKLGRVFDIREKIPITMREFDDVYRAYYLRKAAFEFDRDLSLGRKVIRIDPSAEGFFGVLSAAFERTGNHEMARKYRHRAVRHRDIDGGRVNIRISDGESASPINNLERSRYLSAARLFLKRGDTDRGQRAIKAAAVGTVDPREHLMIMKRLAEIKLAAGNQEEALNSFSRLANRFAAVHLNREALSLFRRVLAVRPESLECLLGSGNALEALGRYCDALAYFRKAQKVMNEGKIVVGRSDVIRKIDFLTKKIESARRASDGA